MPVPRDSVNRGSEDCGSAVCVYGDIERHIRRFSCV